MPHILAQSVEALTTVLAVAGMAYFVAAIVAARVFVAIRRVRLGAFAPGVSILKSLKGQDPGMLDAFRSHCRQNYSGEYELLFGVSSLQDPAAAAVRQLIDEFPERSIRLIECPARLGTNGKVSTLAQLAPLAHYDFLLVNDSDITVGPRYLERVMTCFGPEELTAKRAAEKLDNSGDRGEESFSGAKARADSVGSMRGLKPPPPSVETKSASVLSFSAACKAHVDSVGSMRALKRPPLSVLSSSAARKGSKPVGLVTALYRGRAHGTFASRFEAMGIATDFLAGVLLSRLIEGGLKYGLGSTLAVSREALDRIGGFLPLADHLADDYELGARVSQAGYRVALSAEVVETSIPAYNWRGFADHQLRWARTVRDASPWGYAGLVFTHGLCWAALNAIASGLSPLSLWLLGLSFFLRLTLAMTVGAEVLGDHEVLPGLWLLPVRDAVALGVWAAGFAGHTIVWRGERFELKDGRLHPAD